MSASEKLKALDKRAHEGDYDVGGELTMALPQIRAVVEAAEHVTFYGQEAYKYNEWHGSEIVRALAALDEVLPKTEER